jgi:hypothetical protein
LFKILGRLIRHHVFATKAPLEPEGVASRGALPRLRGRLGGNLWIILKRVRTTVRRLRCERYTLCQRDKLSNELKKIREKASHPRRRQVNLFAKNFATSGKANMVHDQPDRRLQSAFRKRAVQE